MGLSGGGSQSNPILALAQQAVQAASAGPGSVGGGGLSLPGGIPGFGLGSLLRLPGLITKTAGGGTGATSALPPLTSPAAAPISSGVDEVQKFLAMLGVPPVIGLGL